MTTPIIVDDVLPEKYLRDLLHLINNDLEWSYLPVIAYWGEQESIWNKLMVSRIVDDNEIVSKNYDFIYPIIYMVEEKLNQNFGSLFRMKINKTFTVPPDYDGTTWHSDASRNGFLTVILYLDESDGDTLISDFEFYGTAKDLLPHMDNLNNVTTVKYKPNRAVLFDSGLVHHGLYPKHHKCRTAINMVFKKENHL